MGLAAALLPAGGPSVLAAEAQGQARPSASPLGRIISNDPDEVVIVAGGLGFLSREAQPYLARMTGALLDDGRLASGAASVKPPPRDVLGPARALRDFANRAMRNARLPLSSQAVATNAREFKEAFIKARKGRKVRNWGRTIEAAFSETEDKRVAILSLVGSSEVVVAQKGVGSYSEHYFVFVSALLTVPGSGDVIMTGTQGTEYIVNMTAPPATTGEAEELRRLGHFAEAYKSVIEGAVRRLGQAVVRYGDHRNTRKMVSAVSFDGDVLRRLFGLEATALSSLKDLCRPRRLCPAGRGVWCHAAEGMLSEGVTEALSAGGHSVLPPLMWRHWAGSTGKIVLLSTNFLNGEGKIRINVSARSSGQKLMPSIRIREKDFPGETKYNSVRGYKADLQLMWANTRSCRSLDGEGRFSVSAKPVVQKRSGSEFGHDPAIDIRRKYYLLAMFKTLRKLADDADQVPY